MRKTTTLTVLAAALASSAPSWAADPIQLQFEGLTTNVGGVRADVAVGSAYVAQGVSVVGAATATETSEIENPAGGFGTNLVIPFERTLYYLANGTPATDASLGYGAMYVDGDTSASADVTFEIAGGFDTGLAFFYSGATTPAVTVSITGGSAGGTSSTFSAAAACADPDFTRCDWYEASIAFTGKATAITFSGLGQSYFIDNITFGSTRARALDGPPPPIPEPSTYALMVLGLATVGLTARRRRRRA